jgi:hypothetical protein
MSAIVKKNVYLDRYTYKLYPNIYAFLVAKSGHKKGIPISLAKDLVEMSEDTRVIKGRASIQGIIRDLGKAYSLQSGGMIKDAHGFIVSGELAALLVKDPDALKILTDLYNTHEYEKEYTYSLRNSQTEVLKSPCVTLLGATNEENFSEAVPQVDTKNGFIARTFIAFSDEKTVINPLTEPPKNLVDKKRLFCYLKELKKLKGEFKWSDAVRRYYKEWYMEFYKEENFKDREDPTGTFSRIGDQILKAAMLVSLSESPDMELKHNHIYEAITVSMHCAAGMTKITMGNGRSPSSYVTRIVLRDLIQSKDHKLSRKTILSRHWGEFNHFDLDKCIETLLSFDAIEVKDFGKGSAEYTLRNKFMSTFGNYNNQIM